MPGNPGGHCAFIDEKVCHRFVALFDVDAPRERVAVKAESQRLDNSGRNLRVPTVLLIVFLCKLG
jgi:hypothetical protein